MLMSDVEPATVLEHVTRQALDISGADLVVLARPAGGDEQLIIEHAAGTGAEAAIGLILRTRGSVSGTVMNDGAPLAIDDFSHDERVSPVTRAATPARGGVPLPARPARSAASSRPAWASGSMPLSPRAVDAVTTFAAQAGIGLELAEHRQDVQRLALFADRDRIARDLHDQVIQRLFATGMALQGAVARIPEGEASRRVNSAIDALDETIRDSAGHLRAAGARSARGSWRAAEDRVDRR